MNTLTSKKQRIVEWLRERGLSQRTYGAYRNAYDLVADAIERGEHKEGIE